MDFSKLKSVFESKGINEFELYHVVEESTEISTCDQEVDTNTIAYNNEMHIRGVYNNHISTVYVEKDTDDEIEDIANRIIENSKVIESNDPYIIFEGSKEYPVLPEKTHDFDDYTQADLIELCKKVEKYCKDKCEYVYKTDAGFHLSKRTVSIKNSKGLDISRSSYGASIVVECIVNKDGEVKNGYSFQIISNIKDIDYERLYKYSVERTVSSIGAKSVVSKPYPVVLENKIAGSLINCFVSMFSADSVIKKMSLLADKLNKKVFGDNITIVDDPLCKDSPNQYTFDDEGVASVTKTVVENGVLKTYLHDLKTAKMMGVEPTGNGFKFGKGSPSNFCFKTSDVSFDDMIKDIKDGVFITGLMGQHAGCNLASGGFNLQASGFKIENGKVSSPVTLIILSGNIIDAFNNVECISNDFRVDGRIGTGSIYFKSLNISGK